MISEEEKDNTYRISIPLITNAELENISNHQSELVEKIKKAVIRDKELLICQQIIKKQEEQIQRLQKDFEQIDRECSRLEKIDIEKDLEIIKLNKIIYTMAKDIKKLDYDEEDYPDTIEKTVKYFEKKVSEEQ